LYLKPSNNFTNVNNRANPYNKTHDTLLYAKWVPDEREFLKRMVLNFGYGRWKMI